MTKAALLISLRALKLQDDADDSDPEKTHQQADHMLLNYIDDEDIREAFLALTRWYS